MTSLILVHGAFADHYTFDSTLPLLEAKGYRVLTPDLLGHGDDATPPTEITLDRYVDAISGLVVAQPEPVALVGHSMAGMVVSQVAERHPDRIARLGYIAAYLPQSGQSLQELAQSDPDSLIGQNMVFAPDWSTVTIKPERIADALCADAAPDVQQQIVARQKPEPLAPFQGVVTLTAENFGRVPRFYIATGQDQAVTPALQKRMLAPYPDTAVTTLDTSHLPFVVQPEAFVTALLSQIGDPR